MTLRLSFVGAFLLAACEADTRSYYSIVLLNTGSSEVYEVSVRYAGFESIPAGLIPHAEKGQGGVKTDVPGKVTVAWRTADGKDFEKLVDVAGGRPFSELVVTINGSTAEVRLR